MIPEPTPSDRSLIARLGVALIALLAVSLAAPGLAEAIPKYQPTGYWLTVGDEDGNPPRSIIQITKDANGKLMGRIVKLFRQQGEKLEPMCDECDEGYKEANIKGKPALGLVVMWDVEYDEDEEWDDGEILDPANGKTYSVKLEVQKGGQKMEVRGYLGVSLLGRTQTWYRTGKPTGPDHQVIEKGKSWKDLRTAP